MCGIYTFVGWNGRTPDAEQLGVACSLMRHRGPDEQNVKILPGDAPSVGMAHARLAVIDPETGSQPMSNEDGRVWVVHNGEIYNFQEIRRELESAHTFRTNSDTEVILHAYEEYGVECVKRFNGMFSFVLWDAREKRVFMARDRLGQKPLYYCHGKDFFVAASSLQALKSTSGVPREPDWGALRLYFTYQYVPSPLTAFKDVCCLEPAHYAVIDEHGSRRVRYWRPDYGTKTKKNFKESCEEVTSLLSDAVRLRLISDVPLGAFLSGGIDSSITVGIMASLHAGPVRTFSIGFPQKKYDERPFAAAAANRFKTEHAEFEVGPDCIEVMPELAMHHGQPFADSSALPTYYLSKQTRNHVTVALCGDGGDEVFAGYDRYAAMRLAAAFDCVPLGLRKAMSSAACSIMPARSEPRTFSGRMRRFLQICCEEGLDRYLAIIQHLSEDDVSGLLPGIPSEGGLPRGLPLSADFVQATSDNAVERLLELDQLNYLPDDLMVKADVASMAHGLELRSPFLDYRVVELAAAMPFGWKLSPGIRGTSKRILRESYRDMLPKDIRNRGKMGFGIPLAPWLRGRWSEYARSVLLSGEAKSRGIYDTAAMENLLAEHMAERADHSYKIWNLICFESWMKDVAGEH